VEQQEPRVGIASVQPTSLHPPKDGLIDRPHVSTMTDQLGAYIEGHIAHAPFPPIFEPLVAFISEGGDECGGSPK